ncbi:hypothetical protein L9F63_022567, partial [Diploptera punctata]
NSRTLWSAITDWTTFMERRFLFPVISHPVLRPELLPAYFKPFRKLIDHTSYMIISLYAIIEFLKFGNTFYLLYTRKQVNIHLNQLSRLLKFMLLALDVGSPSIFWLIEKL